MTWIMAAVALLIVLPFVLLVLNYIARLADRVEPVATQVVRRAMAGLDAEYERLCARGGAQ